MSSGNYSVSGSAGGKSATLAVSVDTYVVRVEKSTSGDRFSHHDEIRYVAYLDRYVAGVKQVSQTKTITSDANATWTRGDNSPYVSVVSKGVVRSTHYSSTSTAKINRSSGFVVCSYTKDGITYRGSIDVTFYDTYNVWLTFVRENASSYSSTAKLRVRPELNMSLSWNTAVLDWTINAGRTTGEWMGSYTESD